MTDMANRTQTRRKPNRKLVQELLRWGTHIGSLAPLAVLLWEFNNNTLGADPIREILFFTGTAALVLLVISLAITPLNTLLGLKQLIPLRKPTGLYGFMYVCLHLLTFVWLDYGLNWEFIVDGVLNQRFVLVGFIAFLLLVPLALTSNRWSQKRLGKKWKQLHKLTYLVIILSLVHFFWLVKNVYWEPTIYAVIVAILLLLRVKPIRQAVSRQRRKLLGR